MNTADSHAPWSSVHALALRPLGMPSTGENDVIDQDRDEYDRSHVRSRGE
jgi:hypothetical protein